MRDATSAAAAAQVADLIAQLRQGWHFPHFLVILPNHTVDDSRYGATRCSPCNQSDIPRERVPPLGGGWRLGRPTGRIARKRSAR